MCRHRNVSPFTDGGQRADTVFTLELKLPVTFGPFPVKMEAKGPEMASHLHYQIRRRHRDLSDSPTFSGRICARVD
jgi:hypothetical protein